MPTPFHIIPWENDFLTALLHTVLKKTDGTTGDALIIFPHSRPARYLTDLFRNAPQVPRPALMPRMYAVSELFTELRASLEEFPPRPIELLDRVGLMLECIQDLKTAGAWEHHFAGVSSDPLAALPLDDTKRFFPWGVRLVQLLEDCFNRNIVPEDYHYMEGQVVDFAAVLLARLSRIHETYTGKLKERGWTTGGYDAFRSLHLLQKGHPAFLRDKHIFIAGFYGLTGVEEALFKHLWEHYDATILLHTDHELAKPKKAVHWACREHERWLQEWNAQPFLAEEPVARSRAVTFHEGFDLHSQLDVLERTITALDSDEGLESTAVIVPDTTVLMPVLHHLPKKDCNISMGYPLERSTLFRLLETIMRLQETKSSRGYHWKNVIALLRHPYLTMLSCDGEHRLKPLLHTIESVVRTGTAWADPRTLSPAPSEEYSAKALRSLQAQLTKVLDLTLTRWEQLETPAQMAEAIEALCTLLVQDGGTLWERFPVDAESMYRLLQRVVPALRECSLANESFPAGVLYTILRETIRKERVPFEADPLTGLQLLGVLESRLLRFRTVYVLDATEDKLPGAPSHDPLLPDALRSLVGLPDSRHRERVAAYNFHRLIQGAEQVIISYQSGVERTGLFEEKKQRSRFVEEMLWEEEKRQKKLLKAGSPPLYSISYPATTITKTTRTIVRTPAIAAQVSRYLQRPLSPSALDAYLTCPLRFFYERICALGPTEEVNEGDDFAGMGELFHTVLETFFAQYKHQRTDFSAMPPKELQNHFLRALHSSTLRSTIPYDSFIMLETAGPERLARFLANQPATTVIGLEEKLQASVQSTLSPLVPAPEGTGGQHSTERSVTRFLQGRMDRIDQRDSGIVILDYKTGAVKEPFRTVWEEDSLWERLSCWQPGANEDSSLLAELAGAIKSVQLPAYLYIYPRATQKNVYDAGWVELREHGKEKLLLGKAVSPELRHTVITEYIPTVIRFLFRHLENAATFAPHAGPHCQWCSCVNCCSV